MAKNRHPEQPDHIGDLAPDEWNARKHSPRNIGEIADSLRAVGAGRSIVIDETGTILAGHGLVEAAAEVGITKLKVVDADGETIVAVRRTGLTPKQKAELGIRDNRSGESAGWQLDVLEGLSKEYDLDLTKLGFYAEELAELADMPEPGAGPVADKTASAEHTCPSCGYKWIGKHIAGPQ